LKRVRASLPEASVSEPKEESGTPTARPCAPSSLKMPQLPQSLPMVRALPATQVPPQGQLTCASRQPRALNRELWFISSQARTRHTLSPKPKKKGIAAHIETIHVGRGLQRDGGLLHREASCVSVLAGQKRKERRNLRRKTSKAFGSSSDQRAPCKCPRSSMHPSARRRP
jgi:hypothetical protein